MPIPELDKPHRISQFAAQPSWVTTMPRDASDLLHGTLDVLVLKTLSWGPKHGYAVADWIHETTSGELEIVDAALYKSLHRLEDAGAVSAEWGMSDTFRRAKYYSLTAKGRKILRDEAETWRRYAHAVGTVLGKA
jgi:PadR family transcriptional regulator, regulatory protein PadR